MVPENNTHERMSRPPPPGAVWSTIFVWLCWTLLVLGALAFVKDYGINVPYLDDWDLIPVLCGKEPLTPEWLWAQVGPLGHPEEWTEHRIPLPKAILWVVARLTDCDYRAANFLTVFALGGLAAALIRAAKSQRGWVSYADAFFPLVLLNLGGYDVFLWDCIVQLVFSTVLAGILLIIMVQAGSRLTPAKGMGAGTCLVLLPLSGSNGVALVPALAVWLAYAGLRHRSSREGTGRRYSVLLWALVIVAVALVVLCLAGQKNWAPQPGIRATVRTGVQFLSMGFGPASIPFWPYSGLAILGLALGSGVLLLVICGKHAKDRLGASGLLLFLGAFVCLALGVGAGRAGWGPDSGFQNRYVILAAPVLCCIYFAWGITNHPGGAFLQMCLFTFMCVLFYQNLFDGMNNGKARFEAVQAFEQELQAGVPPFLLAERHAYTLYPDNLPWVAEYLASGMRVLHGAGIGVFRLMHDDPTFRKVHFPTEPLGNNQIVYQNGVYYGFGTDSCLTLALSRPQWVYAVRFKCRYENKPDSASIRVFWKKGASKDSAETERNMLCRKP